MVGERPHLPPQQPAPDRIHVVGRLVEHHHASWRDGRHGKGHEPLHTAGEPGGIDIEPLPDLEGIDEALASMPHVRPGTTAQLADQVDRLPRRETVDRHLRLSLEGAQASREARVGDHVAPIDPDCPAARLQQPDHLVDESRLAGAIVA
jgi:hypothetical protein